MRPNHENIENSTTKKEYIKTDKAKWGQLTAEPHSNINEWQQGQQGFMSVEEVAGEATTSDTLNPKFKIPKMSEKKVLAADRLNQLATSISPPAKERKKEASNTTQPHKNK